MARELMNRHGLGHVPLEFNRAKTFLGYCQFNRATGEVRKIVMSTEYIDVLPVEEVRDTILHEIAHAKVGIDEGHGLRWKNVARQVGAIPKRCAAPSVKPKGAIVGKCPKGHESKAFYRMPQRVRSCGTCSPGRFNADAVYVWYKDGKRIPLNNMPVKYQREVNRSVAPKTFTLDDVFSL